MSIERQPNLNTIILSLLTGFVTVSIGVFGWFFERGWHELRATHDAVIKLEYRVEDINTIKVRLTAIEVEQVAAKLEFVKFSTRMYQTNR